VNQPISNVRRTGFQQAGVRISDVSSELFQSLGLRSRQAKVSTTLADFIMRTEFLQSRPSRPLSTR
jgi:hypothetical protein